MTSHRGPKLHNAMWPGLVGKGSPGAEPAMTEGLVRLLRSFGAQTRAFVRTLAVVPR